MRYELTEYEWASIKPMLPNNPRGVPRVNDRRVLNGILWVLRSGAPWRDLPENYGLYTTCYNRFVRWRRAELRRTEVTRCLPSRWISNVELVRFYKPIERRWRRARVVRNAVGGPDEPTDASERLDFVIEIYARSFRNWPM